VRFEAKGRRPGEQLINSDQLLGVRIALFPLSACWRGSAVYGATVTLASGTRYEPGSRKLFPVGLLATTLLLAGLLFWQFSDPIRLERPTVAQRLASELEAVVQKSGLAKPVEVRARFVRPVREAPPTLLGEVYVQPVAASAASAEALRRQLTRRLQGHLQRHYPTVVPLVSVGVLEPPPDATPAGTP
jgi:hypothetical protein